MKPLTKEKLHELMITKNVSRLDIHRIYKLDYAEISKLLNQPNAKIISKHIPKPKKLSKLSHPKRKRSSNLHTKRHKMELSK